MAHNHGGPCEPGAVLLKLELVHGPGDDIDVQMALGMKAHEAAFLLNDIAQKLVAGEMRPSTKGPW